jgi:hypothetical protein
VRGEKGPHALQQRTGQKQELTIKLCPAQSSAPLTTRSHPYGSHKCTRSARLEQSVSLSATRRPSTVSVLWERSEGAFFIRRRSCWPCWLMCGEHWPKSSLVCKSYLYCAQAATPNAGVLAVSKWRNGVVRPHPIPVASHRAAPECNNCDRQADLSPRRTEW